MASLPPPGARPQSPPPLYQLAGFKRRALEDLSAPVLDAIAKIQKLISQEKKILNREFLGYGFQDPKNSSLEDIIWGQEDKVLVLPGSPFDIFQKQSHFGKRPFTVHNHLEGEPPSEEDLNQAFWPDHRSRFRGEHYNFGNLLNSTPRAESIQALPKIESYDPEYFRRWKRGLDLGRAEEIYGEDFELPDHVIRENLRRFADEDWFNYTVFE